MPRSECSDITASDHTLDISLSQDNLGLEGHDVVEAAMRASAAGSRAGSVYSEPVAALDETLDLSASFGALDDATLQRVIVPPSQRQFRPSSEAFETSADFVVVMEYAYGELFEIFTDDKHLPESD